MPVELIPGGARSGKSRAAEPARLVAALVVILPALRGRILLVSNEIGLGVAPKMTLMMAGLPVEIKTGA